jgi:hypothetical protein
MGRSDNPVNALAKLEAEKQSMTRVRLKSKHCPAVPPCLVQIPDCYNLHQKTSSAVAWTPLSSKIYLDPMSAILASEKKIKCQYSGLLLHMLFGNCSFE